MCALCQTIFGILFSVDSSCRHIIFDNPKRCARPMQRRFFHSAFAHSRSRCAPRRRRRRRGSREDAAKLTELNCLRVSRVNKRSFRFLRALERAHEPSGEGGGENKVNGRRCETGMWTYRPSGTKIIVLIKNDKLINDVQCLVGLGSGGSTLDRA